MPTAAFANLGCKVNQYEIEKIAESFVLRGFEIAPFDGAADVYVINTCSVTGAADRKSRHMARKAARRNENARVVLTGCFAQLAIDTREKVEGASLLVPNKEKMRVAEHTLAAFPELAAGGAPVAPASLDGRLALFPEDAGLVKIDPPAANSLPRNLTRTRATLKVQDGCVHFCAFCSIPYTRSVMGSRPLTAVVDEASRAAASGVREVVVTGVCVGAYRDGDKGLADLLHAVADVPGIERVRLSSIQPIETDQALIDAVAGRSNICPHLHLSLQSGSDVVLKAMQRPYDTDYYRRLAARLRLALPDIAITTDIIVGFPGETDAEFENTLAFAQEMAFSRTHIFRYSARRRTFAAEHFKDDVPEVVKEARHKALAEVCGRTQKQFASKRIGRTVAVLAESRGNAPGRLCGYTDDYLRVQFDDEAPSDSIGRIVPVRIDAVLEDGEAVGKRI